MMIIPIFLVILGYCLALCFGVCFEFDDDDDDNDMNDTYCNKYSKFVVYVREKKKDVSG